MTSKFHIVFFYSRLADYFYQCILYFLTENEHYSATVIAYPKDESAPFKFAVHDRVRLMTKLRFTERELIELVNSENTVALYFAGWNDKTYLKVAKYFRHKVPTISGIDNPWNNSTSQRFKSWLFKRYLHNRFSHLWCAGTPQIDFALRLGYKHHEILKGLYSANTEIFNSFPLARSMDRKKNLLFLGRYVKYKNPHFLLSVFAEILEEGNTNGWSITLVGSGPLENGLRQFENEHIKVKDFIEPSLLPELFNNSGAFCLPSSFEHWGVVVHEAVAAGLPLILSDTVFSHTEFLINGHNGWLFKTDDRISLKRALLKLFHLSDESLADMERNSFYLSKRINQAYWSANLKSAMSGMN